jgi:dGTPase
VRKGGGAEDYAEAWRHHMDAKRLRETRVRGRSPLDARTEFENDLDRVIFSSSFRRLRNKAQVFSLEPHDFVRTRLTHSIEVSTVGRSLGEGAASATQGVADALKAMSPSLTPRDVGTVVATACLLHDIGNPPFGHSGERAIGTWFGRNIDAKKRLKLSDSQERADLTMFEGNAQALRVATRLQWSGQDYGMNLTVATLSALIKYPCSSNEVNSKGPKPLKKFGYFKTDGTTFKDIRSHTGLDGYRRNPLTYLMEAANDLAYATGDIEDVLKKGFVDYQTIDQILGDVKSKESKECVDKFLRAPYQEEFKNFEPRERRQLSVQRFCQMAIRLMMKSVINAFVEKYSDIMDGMFAGDLVGAMSMNDLHQALTRIMKDHVYSHIEIADREQTARNVIAGLLSAVVEELQDRPGDALARTTYRAAPLHYGESSTASENYKIAQRACDYVSGMTDGHALAQYQRISGMRITF